jgi:predicted acetyltransferase
LGENNLSVIPNLATVTFADGDLELQFLDFCSHPVHRVPAYRFRMMHVRSGEELGGINLRIGSTPHIERYAGHIGYHVHPEYRGHRFAARSVRLLLPLARRHDLAVLWITCDPDNAASRRTAEIAGAQFVEIVDVPETCIIYQSGHPRKCRYRLVCAPATHSPLIA